MFYFVLVLVSYIARHHSRVLVSMRLSWLAAGKTLAALTRLLVFRGSVPHHSSVWEAETFELSPTLAWAPRLQRCGSISLSAVQ